MVKFKCQLKREKFDLFGPMINYEIELYHIVKGGGDIFG